MRLAVLLLAIAGAVLGAESRDTIYLKGGANGGTKQLTNIDHEYVNELEYHSLAGGKPSTKKYSDIDHWTYAEMEDGYWPKSIDCSAPLLHASARPAHIAIQPTVVVRIVADYHRAAPTHAR